MVDWIDPRRARANAMKYEITQNGMRTRDPPIWSRASYRRSQDEVEQEEEAASTQKNKDFKQLFPMETYLEAEFFDKNAAGWRYGCCSRRYLTAKPKGAIYIWVANGGVCRQTRMLPSALEWLLGRYTGLWVRLRPPPGSTCLGRNTRLAAAS